MEMKKFTKAEKINILKESAKVGVKVTLAKYGLYPATFYYWKKKFDELGDTGLDHGLTRDRLTRIRKLEKEVLVLKQIVAEKELEGRLKDELLKKKYPWARKKKS